MENRETFADGKKSREANSKNVYTVQYAKNLGRYFLNLFQRKTKVHIVVKRCEKFFKGQKKSVSGKMTHRVCDKRKIGVVNSTCLKREDGLLQFILIYSSLGNSCEQ